MSRKDKPVLTNITAHEEAEKLDALNARTRRKGDVTRLMEATIESKAKKRRRQDPSLSSALKRSG